MGTEGKKTGRYWLLTATGVLSLCVSTLGSADYRIGPSHVPTGEALYGDLYNPTTQIFKRGRRGSEHVTLTIDDGPYPESLPKILEVLRRYDAKATFFMVGKRMREHPELVRQVLEEGHEIGNHTQNHPRLNSLAPDMVRAELALCEQSYRTASGGQAMRLFRAPGMKMTPVVEKIVREFGYVSVFANYGAKDFRLGHSESTLADQESIPAYVLENVTPGGIILLHDVPETAESLEQILKGLQSRGLKSVTAGTLLAEVRGDSSPPASR